MQALQGFGNIKGILTVPGIATVEYASLEEINIPLSYQSLTDDTHAQQRPIVFLSGKSWRTMPVFFDKNAFQRNQGRSDQGILHSFSLSGVIPAHNEGIMSELDRLPHHRLIVRILDISGVQHILGTVRNPLSFTSNSILNSQQRQHVITITGTSTRIPPYLVVA